MNRWQASALRISGRETQYKCEIVTSSQWDESTQSSLKNSVFETCNLRSVSERETNELIHITDRKIFIPAPKYSSEFYAGSKTAIINGVSYMLIRSKMQAENAAVIIYGRAL